MAFDNDPAETPTQDAAQPATEAVSPAPEAAPAPVATTPEPEKPGEPKTALDAVLKALDGRVSGDATAAKPAEPSAEATPTPAAAAEDAQDESLADVPKLPAEVFSALPKEARTAFNALRKQVNGYRESAERGNAVTEYLQNSGVTPDEFGELQRVGALMKRDPEKALAALEEHVDRLKKFLGYEIADDLRNEVEQGFMPEERARELSQARAKAGHAEAAVREHAAATAARERVGAVEAWENDIRARDPDFDAKLPNVQQATKLAILERERAGKPVATHEDALEVVKAAYEQTNAMFARFRPKPAPVPATPSSAAPVAQAMPRAPTTALEAAWAALGQPPRG